MTPYYADALVTLYHGDCREILPTLESGSVRLLWTDPPYGHGNQQDDLQAARKRAGVKGGSTLPLETIANDGRDEMRDVVDVMLTASARLMCRDCCCCCCCGGGGPTPTFAWLAQRLDFAPWKFFHAVVWDKTDRGPGMGWKLRRDYEFVMTAHLSAGRFSWDGDARSNIIRVQPDRERQHPNQKPEALVAEFINAATAPGDLVLDPFMGSGTTLVAAKRLGRKAIGIELDEKYCEIAAQRLAQGSLVEMFTGEATS